MGILKPIRWVASTLWGNRGRKLIDRYSAEIEEVVEKILPDVRELLFESVGHAMGLKLDMRATYGTTIVDALTERGVPEKDAKSLVRTVTDRIEKEVYGA
jgi:hypothetical protein